MKKVDEKKCKKNLILNIFMGILFILLGILLYDLFYGISLSSTFLSVGNHPIRIEVPSYLKVIEDNGEKIEFQTFRSVPSIKKDMKKITNGYQEVDCGTDIYLYNPVEDYTVVYEVDRGLLYNRLTIRYQEGKIACASD